jgi:hypothetical protein
MKDFKNQLNSSYSYKSFDTGEIEILFEYPKDNDKNDTNEIYQAVLNGLINLAGNRV